MENESPLVLTFDPQTVDHLGAKMYSHLPNALAELVANAYDADATQVLIRIESNGSVSITDDGHGMSREDVSTKYLHIGRNRRLDQSASTESGRRRVSGKKGLGKLALFGIGKRVELMTTRSNSKERTCIVMSYDDMMASDGAYRPTESQGEVTLETHGTAVRLSDLKRTSPINGSDVAVGLARLFNYVDADFKIVVESPEGERFRVTPESRLDAVDVEFEWNFPQDWSDDDAFELSKGTSGHIVASKTPLRHGMRGITLYVKGRLANEPEYFGASESSYAYSYLSGYLAVDYLDDLDPDVIATDRRAIDWDTEETMELRDRLQMLVARIGLEWRQRRKLKKKDESEAALGSTTEEWVNSIRTEEREAVRGIVAAIESDDVEIPVAQQTELLRMVQKVAPPRAEYVWRHLHPEIQQVTRAFYERDDFYTAVNEAIKRYVNRTKSSAGLDSGEAARIVSQAFGGNGKLQVFAPYLNLFDPSTAYNVEQGQMHVSMGVVAGFRNPLAHEEVEKLHSSGAFSFDDCLDALSIISHLMRRLDGAQHRP
ncbi:TIGR02391 family protein [Salinibacterium sp. NK8237]|uniref:TIGR02391 family protein n=1 Tax=Salinibacterium sp. NK8237 TaxID=2792038 RepID=UPI0018CD6CE5|nr:TIGR02391 family protein [Salinibacterium sp. NK8237]MBH0129977.1 TIGR02391 family protein [Salinibacterium sp. NK8237]